MAQTDVTLADIAACWRDITQALIEIVDRVATASTPAIAWTRPSGELVTDMELRIDIELRATLARLAPALPVLSEEIGRLDPAPVACASELVAILDPIDGTRSLIEQTDAWHCSLAICECARPKLGVVYQPTRRVIYDSTHTQPAPAAAAAAAAAGNGVVALSASAIRADPGLVARLEAAQLRPTPVAHAVEKIVCVLDGRADAAIAPARISHPFYSWDIAAAAVIADAHGLTLRCPSGARLDFGDLEQPLCTGWICARDERVWTQIRDTMEDGAR
jgi:myo-inositol-1(or 4)-monophosphatase